MGERVMCSTVGATTVVFDFFPLSVDLGTRAEPNAVNAILKFVATCTVPIRGAWATSPPYCDARRPRRGQDEQ